MGPRPYLAGVVIPAHNEERAIGRLLHALQPDPANPNLEIVVVCNGCTDGTAEVARRMAPQSTVIEIEMPSKKEALRVGDRAVRSFPRIFIDADVEINNANVIRLITPLNTDGRLAAGPRRILSKDGIRILVRSYYDVWERLPQVRSGLFGRGVVALSEEGNQRVQRLPLVMSDDLVMSEAFSPDERVIVADAVVIVHPPTNLKDLIRRRVRVATGNSEADNAGLRGSSAKTSLSSLWRMIVEEPILIPKVPIFLGVTLAARVIARRAIKNGDYATWHRDESSRS